MTKNRSYASLRRVLLGGLALALPIATWAADGTLKNDAFDMKYGARGINSLKRTSDVADTEYLTPGAFLGSLVVRYRADGTADWSEAREVNQTGTPTANSVNYSLGTLLPTLAAKSSRAASSNNVSSALDALNDDRFPPPPPPAGAAGRGRGARGGAAGRGRGARGGAPAGPAIFTWNAEPGTAQWVEYKFPAAQSVGSAQVMFGTNTSTDTTALALPASWKVLYHSGQDWKEVQPSSPYTLEPTGVFNRVAFAPVTTDALRVEVKQAAGTHAGISEWRVGDDERVVGPLKDLQANENFKLDGGTLTWTLTLENQSDKALEVGDLALPLNFSERTGNRGDIYTQKLLRHSFVSGNGSWIYWQRSNAVGPYLVMVPQGDSKFEYYDIQGGGAPIGVNFAGVAGNGGRGPNAAGTGGGYTPFIHATVSNQNVIAQAKEAGRAQPWRLPLDSLKLAPKGQQGASKVYTFKFEWAPNFDGVRDVLYKDNSFDINVVPGMSIPTDLEAMFSLRTKNKIDEVAAEFPDKTKVTFVGDKGDGNKVYKVKFDKLGENMLKVKYDGDKWSSLEFFVTEPLETVIEKRANFLTTKMQHKDPSQWWYGVYSDYDQVNHILRSPLDRDGLSAWLTDASDDAGNARPAYVASKNAFLPKQSEIDSVELYIKYYLWQGQPNAKSGKGGMQMTEAEKWPYGVYGTFQNWYQHRNWTTPPPVGRNGRVPNVDRDHVDHLWRIYDYPHIMLMYYRMYQIAKQYPTMVHYQDANGYLDLAYNTTVAYWTVPFAIERWSGDAVPTMNEAFVPELIDALEREGRKDQAAKVRSLWEHKVDKFVNRTPNLFGSEFAFDSTGFESTGAMGYYAIEHAKQPGEKASAHPSTDAAFQTSVTMADAKKFNDFQLLLDMGDRGWLENTYFQLGSDYRGSLSYLLSYMSQMGGWTILNYGLNTAQDPTEYLRLGYASSLSSWCLMNTGTKESNYGYWYPGPEDDGGTGGGFMPEVMGRGWIGKTMPRGAWHYSAEEDVGYAGALRNNATIVTKDPVFGEFAYGGALTRDGNEVKVVPRDGLRARFHVIRGDQRLHMALEGDNFAQDVTVGVKDDLSKIEFTVQNKMQKAHNADLIISGLPEGNYKVSVGGKAVEGTRLTGGTKEQRIKLPIGTGDTDNISIEKAS